MNAVLDRQYDVFGFEYPENLARYEHEGVIGKFRDEWDVEEAEALDIFSEMKKFLYVSEYAQKQCIEFEIDEPILMIDKMWHHFILFTNDYEKFCNRFFGKMLHHIPFCSAHLSQKIKALSREGITLNDHKRDRLEKQLRVISSTFGNETLKKWYVEYGSKYSPEKVNVLQRPTYHGELEKLGTPIDQKAASKMADIELMQCIIQRISPSMYCGRGCGMYCTCNSSGNIYA
ncbi:hypothetical protein WL05_19555 [Burkholderia ubonensis]|uniref:hypothetical protein n=1 Tax=Burkholderia ubonensis TaxID=101571 RepID=UPI000758F4C1|nr:hypothetical protein [Burkholderia ubonensis]KVM18283.1 hypothetical protein WJ52_11365 [Burkholderia ubonensis]KVM21761.1 hypothetical protein WJ51_03535 [Burkholderia ubonensis]KVM43967.1 hypothetical protein WJ56_28275 [Burkholderia ubonensis]KVO23822.1 hypothetical protein WJ74_32955 [Burkholderia ubonensis]KVX46214.1 hypothetical protein WL05_19555 [Burkholderia ubonensis]